MRPIAMKNIVCLFLSLCFVRLDTYSQVSSQCKITSIQSGIVQKLNYSVSKAVADGVKYNTTYMVTDKSGIPYKIFKVSNNVKDKEVYIEIQNKTGELEDNYPISYSQFAGMILIPENEQVTFLIKPYSYLYVLSFEDEKKQFVNLHFITKLADYSASFSSVSDSLLARNKEMLHQIELYKGVLLQQEATRKADEEKRLEHEAAQRREDSIVNLRVNRELAAEREKLQLQKEILDSIEKEKTAKKVISNDNIIVGIDSLCRQFISDSIKVKKMEDDINNAIRKYSNEESDIDGDRRYKGDKKNGSWQGNGLMIVANRKIYKGIFENGQFVSGFVILKYEKGDQYCGEYSYATPRGFGKLATTNEDLSLGYFGAGGFERGIIRKTYTDGSNYYGQATLDKKDGFGIFFGPTGSKYIGLFKSDRLQEGYSSQTDDVGAKTFFKYTDFVKVPIDPDIWGKFVEEYNKLKSIYNQDNRGFQNKVELQPVVASAQEQQRIIEWLRRNGPVWGHLKRHNSGPDVGVQIHKIEKDAKLNGIPPEELKKFRDKNYMP